MSETTAVAPGESPPATPEVPKVQIAPAPEAPASSLKQPSDLGERAQKAKTPLDIRQIIADGKKRIPLPPPDATPPLPPVVVAPPAAAEVAETPPEGDAPEAEAAPGSQAPEVETDSEVEIPDEADGPITPTTAKRPRISMAPDDIFGRTLASIKSRNKDWSTEEAIAATYKQLGLRPAAESAAPATAPKPKSDLPETVEAVDQSIDSLLQERRKANSETRFEDADDIDIKIRKLDRHRLALERDADRAQIAAERNQAQAAQNYDKQFDVASTKATDLYAFASEPDSPGGKLMKQFDQQLEDSGDPRFHSPDKPLLCAHWAAAKLNIPPRLKGAAPAPVKTAVPAAPKQNKQVLPSGSARTTPPAAPQQPAIETQARAMKSPHDFRKLMKQFK